MLVFRLLLHLKVNVSTVNFEFAFYIMCETQCCFVSLDLFITHIIIELQ